MTIKVAVLFEDKFEGSRRRYSDLLRFLLRTQGNDLNIFEVGMADVSNLLKTGELVECDALIIHMGYEIEGDGKYNTLYAKDIVKKLIPEDSRRIVVSKEKSGSVSKEVMQKIGADCYFCSARINEGEFFQILRMGRVDSEGIKLRNFAIRVEDGEIVKAEMGLDPERDLYDDKKYFKQAKER